MDLSPNKINQKSNNTSWVCPCNGCKKAKQQAYQEILNIIEGGGDAYSRINAIKELITKKN